MFDYLKPISPKELEPGSTETAKSSLHVSTDCIFKPTMTFQEFGNFLWEWGEKMPYVPSGIESISERIKEGGELGLIAPLLKDVGLIFAVNSNLFEERNLRYPDVIEYENSAFNGKTLVTEPHVSLQKICDYLTKFCYALEKEPTNQSWDLTDLAKLLYLLGVDAISSKENRHLHERIDKEYSQAAQEAGIQLRGRGTEAMKQELWQEVEKLFPNGFKHLIKPQVG